MTRAAIADSIVVPLRRAADTLIDALPESPRVRLAWVATLASAATLVIVGAIGYAVLHKADASRAERLGKALAEELAVLAIEPLIAGDRIHLGVLANRIAELDAVSNVTVVTIDDRVLAEVGSRVATGVQLAAPILLEGDLAGYARVTIAPGAFGTRGSELAALLFGGLAAALLCGAAAYAVGRRIERRRRQLLDAEAAAAANDAAHAEPTERYYLVINLFNQRSLPSAERQTVIAACASRLGAIARSFRGRCDPLPGTGLLMQFDGCANDGYTPAPSRGVGVEATAEMPPPERAFEAVCAALLAVDVVGELLAAPPIAGTPMLDFRLALHVLRLPAEDRLLSDAINDTVLFSAVAPSREIAASHDLFARVPQNQMARFSSRTQENPALHALTTARKGSCVLIASVDGELRAELDRQVDKLIGAVPSTSRPSAF